LAELHEIPTFVARVRKTAKNLTSIRKTKAYLSTKIGYIIDKM